jgi:hypothetical protein
MSQDSILVTVWAKGDSPRLRYVLDWLLKERLGLDYRISSDEAEARNAATGLAYGWAEGPPSIHDEGLLWETGIRKSDPELSEWEGLQTLFLNAESACDIQFDMLGGIFYLLSRYEEYFSFLPDRHGRYPAAASVLFPVLERPVVDEWVASFRQFLEQVWGLQIPVRPFSFEASYDIDIAWKYRNKGLKRNLGAALRDLLRRRFQLLDERRQATDPWDAYVFLFALHMMDDMRPLYFVLAASQPSPFDKNISPEHPKMALLIKAFAEGGRIGVHPSYYSDVKPERMTAEKAALERVSGNLITRSRQHFIKLEFSGTYRALIAAGITDDYSMGYSTTFGFRAGTGVSFLWYDLENEQQTGLRVHPFAFMDTTGHYDLGLSAKKSFERLRKMSEQLIALNSKLVTIMHNFSLGTDLEWMGWREGYEEFLGDLRKVAGGG